GLSVVMMGQCGLWNIPTFRFGFDAGVDQTDNEFNYSDIIANTFGTDHHTLHLSSAEFSSAVGDAIGAMTEPMASHDVPAFYLHSQQVAGHANIVQSGQGADEIFAGYGYHRAAEAVQRETALT